MQAERGRGAEVRDPVHRGGRHLDRLARPDRPPLPADRSADHKMLRSGLRAGRGPHRASPRDRAQRLRSRPPRRSARHRRGRWPRRGTTTAIRGRRAVARPAPRGLRARRAGSTSANSSSSGAGCRRLRYAVIPTIAPSGLSRLILSSISRPSSLRNRWSAPGPVRNRGHDRGHGGGRDHSRARRGGRARRRAVEDHVGSGRDCRGRGAGTG